MTNVRIMMVLGIVGGLGCGGGDEDADGDGELPMCVRDSVDEIDQAVAINAGESTEGWLCPRGDQDWYKFSLGAADRLVQVQVSMNTDRAPVEPVVRDIRSFRWRADGRGCSTRRRRRCFTRLCALLTSRRVFLADA